MQLAFSIIFSMLPINASMLRLKWLNAFRALLFASGHFASAT